MAALSACGCGVVAALLGQLRLATGLLLTACILASIALRVFQRSQKPAKTLGVSPSFPYFVRGAYAWLLVAASLGVYAAQSDAHGGIWAPSRHALTVGSSPPWCSQSARESYPPSVGCASSIARS